MPRYKLIAAPVAEPVTLAEAKAHLRVDGTDDDAYISALISAARRAAETETGRALMPQTWELALDRFADGVALAFPPLISITSISYIDADGVTQTLAPSVYKVDSHSVPARLLRAYGQTWPDTRDEANAVLIRFQAGYADAASVPQEIKQWMLLQIGSLYANRESLGDKLDTLTLVDVLLNRYKVFGL